MKLLPTSAIALLLSLSLLSCGKKTADNPQPSTPAESPAVEVPNAPVAPTGAANTSRMQVRVTSVGLGALQSSAIISASTSLYGTPYTLPQYTYGFNGDMNQPFNVGTMAAYQTGGLVYHYTVEARIKGIASAGSLPANANMWVELIKDGQVVATNRVPANSGLSVSVEWRNNPAFIYSTCSWDSH